MPNFDIPNSVTLLIAIIGCVSMWASIRASTKNNRTKSQVKEIVEDLLLQTVRFDKVLTAVNSPDYQDDCTLSIEAIKEDLQANMVKLEKIGEKPDKKPDEK